MEWTEILQNSINYMEAHLLDHINYENVATQMHMSNYNFHRTFSFMAGMTANEYIRNRRLSLAGQELMETGAKVIDVALKYGYETPESFAKAFTRFHGVSPKCAKVPGTKLSLFNPLVIRISMEGGKMMDYRIVEGTEKKCIALVRSFSNEIINEEGNHDIPDFWGECHEMNLIEPLRKLRKDGKKDLYGLCSPAKADEKNFNYGIGVLIDEDTNQDHLEELLQNGYQMWDITPCKYVVLQCFGEDGDCIDKTWKRFYNEFLPQTGYESSDNTDFEIYPECGEKGLFCELWIPIQKK